MARYLRHKKDGYIYIYNEYLARRDDMEEVSEAEVEGKKPAKKQKETKKPEAPVKEYTGPAI